MNQTAEGFSQTEESPQISSLALALANLVQSVEFMPLGVRGLVAVAEAKTALGGVSASGYALSDSEHNRFEAFNRLFSLYSQLSHEQLAINAVGCHLISIKQKAALLAVETLLKQRTRELGCLSDEMTDVFKQVQQALL